MVRFLLLLVALLIGAGCQGKTFTIADVEAIGFVKDQRQFFEMIAARDGWSGTFEDERVELYEYPDAASVPEEFFASGLSDTNFGNWVDYCIVGNLAMLSQGKRACEALGSLE